MSTITTSISKKVNQAEKIAMGDNPRWPMAFFWLALALIEALRGIAEAIDNIGPIQISKGE